MTFLEGVASLIFHYFSISQYVNKLKVHDKSEVTCLINR